MRFESSAKTKLAAPSSFGISVSDRFEEWLGQSRSSLVIATSRSGHVNGHVYAIGLDDSGALSVFERTFGRVHALHADDNSLYLAVGHMIWRLENVLRPGQRADGRDALFVPQLAYVTGDLDIHDLALDTNRQILFANTRCDCIARVDDRYSFLPLWQPDFVTGLDAGDCCHLSGFAVSGGIPRMATIWAYSDKPEGWRDQMADGGMVIDVADGVIAAAGLSMPSSPRIHGGLVWLLESGAGRFGFIDSIRGRFQPVTFCPGYAGALAFIENNAVIGLSRPHEHAANEDLPLFSELRRRDLEPFCGAVIVDMDSGDMVHWLRIDSEVDEVSGIAPLPGFQRPALVTPFGPEAKRLFYVPGPSFASS